MPATRRRPCLPAALSLARLEPRHRDQTREHAPVFTVEEAQALRGEIPGGHCKNLFLKDEKGALYLIVCLEDAPRRSEDRSRRDRLAAACPSASPIC